jgi:hypothetical protein
VCVLSALHLTLHGTQYIERSFIVGILKLNDLRAIKWTVVEAKF